MSYRKEYIVDGGCPESLDKRGKIISVYNNDFEGEPIYRTSINCDMCANYFACTFQYQPCSIIKKLKTMYCNNTKRNIQNEFQLKIGRNQNLHKVINSIQRVIENTK